MHTLRAQKTDVQYRIAGGLEFQAKAGLDPVWRLVIIVEAGDDCIAKEATSGDRPTRTEAQRSSIWISSTKKVRKRDGGDVRRAGKSKEARGGIEGIFIGASGVRAAGSAAGRLLARQQRHGNNSVEDSAAATQDNVVLGAKAVSKAGARIELLVLFAQQFGGESFKLVAQAVIQGQIFNRAPVVLQIQAAVGV